MYLTSSTLNFNFHLFQEDAEQRKIYLEKVLQEHAEIVQEIGDKPPEDNMAPLDENRDHWPWQCQWPWPLITQVSTW